MGDSASSLCRSEASHQALLLPTGVQDVTFFTNGAFEPTSAQTDASLLAVSVSTAANCGAGKGTHLTLAGVRLPATDRDTSVVASTRSSPSREREGEPAREQLGCDSMTGSYRPRWIRTETRRSDDIPAVYAAWRCGARAA
jgi:hypothetical protein